MPTPYNGGQAPLEVAALAARAMLIPINTYNNVAPANEYSATHTRALSDVLTPYNGKGSGQFLDITNYGGVGSVYDIYGNPSIQGSGMLPELTLNSTTWGYGPTQIGMQNYVHPDTSGNIGQVVL